MKPASTEYVRQMKFLNAQRIGSRTPFESLEKPQAAK